MSEHCINCGLAAGDYTLPDKQGKLWTIDMMESIADENFFDYFTEDVFDKCDWKGVVLNKRHGAMYCRYCEGVLFADEIRNERIITARLEHEEQTGQMQMFPNMSEEVGNG